MPFSSSDIDRIGIAQRSLRERPRAVHIGPRCRFDDDLQGLRLLESRRQVYRLKGMTRSVRRGAEAGHDFEGEMARRDEWLGGRNGSQRSTCGDTSCARIGHCVNDQGRVDYQRVGRPIN